MTDTNDSTGQPPTGEPAEPRRITEPVRVTFERPPGEALPITTTQPLPVTLERAGESAYTPDVALWAIIRTRTRALSFPHYKRFIDRVMCGKGEPEVRASGEQPSGGSGCDHEQGRRVGCYHGTNAYEALRISTEAFLLQECGMAFNLEGLGPGSARPTRLSPEELRRLRDEYLVQLSDELGTSLPYFKLIVDRLQELPLKEANAVAPDCYGILRSRVSSPCFIELIHEYWEEQGMVVQSMKAISLRFQNRRIPSSVGEDPLVRLDIDPLRPLNPFLWGFIQEEQKQLSVARRAYEYNHQYGLTLEGKAVPTLRPVDSRSRFLEGFHHLLNVCATFFHQVDDTTIAADAFPVLTALKEVHLLLAQGAHNQYGDLPWQARAEMLVQQWLLARPEMREFLGGRAMVPYAEAWMDRVDTMKTLQGWIDVSITHFHILAVTGEQLLLSIRFGSWAEVDERASAYHWATFWRSEIQSYLHAYQAVTGVDLSRKADATPPTELLRNRLKQQKKR